MFLRFAQLHAHVARLRRLQSMQTGSKQGALRLLSHVALVLPCVCHGRGFEVLVAVLHRLRAPHALADIVLEEHRQYIR